MNNLKVTRNKFFTALWIFLLEKRVSFLKKETTMVEKLKEQCKRKLKIEDFASWEY